jgi:GNAT superfamily N-acetyltransferase
MQQLWKPVTQEAWATIIRIGDEIHPTFVERPEVFEEKFRLCPHGCFVLERAGTVVGYGFAHPWLLNEIPKLDAFLGCLPPRPDCFFIHDVALLPCARGQGAGGAYVALISDLAAQDGIDHLALVSVYDTQPIWARCGFVVSGNATISANLASYGSGARHMISNRRAR